MKHLKYLIFLLSISCVTPGPGPTPPPPKPIVKTDTIWNHVHLNDTIWAYTTLPDTVYVADGEVSVKQFGAYGDGVHDDYAAIQSACDACIENPAICTTVKFPVGFYRITKPILLQHVVNGANAFFTVNLTGEVSNKPYLVAYGSNIMCDFNQGFGIGIELGRGILIKNLSVIGKYQFPNSVNNNNIGTVKYADWNDGSVVDSRYSPYAGISIDPYPLLQGGSGGTSAVEINSCAIKQFMIGIVLSPTGTTQNAEMINIIDDNIDAVKIAIAICQDQSKEIHIDRLKVWASVHTVLDGVNYGRGTGGGSVMIEGMNIAGNVNQLFNVYTDRFPLSAKDIYSESIFRIGSVGAGANANFINFQIDFLTGAGMPAADYLLLGYANFYGGCLRFYNNDFTQRMNFGGMGGIFRDMTLSSRPLYQGLYGLGTNHYVEPHFDNVGYYYNAQPDTLIHFTSIGNLVFNKTNWTATLTGTGVQVGDYILGSPNSTNRKFYDNPNLCNTIQIGRVTSIVGSTVNLDQVAINAPYITGYDAFYISRFK